MQRLKVMLLVMGLVGLTLTSCRKAATATASDDSQSSKDVNSVSNAINATADDAANAAGQVKSFSGKTESHWWSSAVLCGATTVDTGTPGNHVITITYDGTTTCNGVIRSGTVTISNAGGVLWNQAGAQLTINMNNLHITDPVTSAAYIINGTHTITNETGGLAWQVIAGTALANTTVSHRNTSSNMTITFADGTQRSWTEDRTRSWSNANGHITVSVYSEAAGNVSETGTNRYGQSFTNIIMDTISANNNASCTWKPYIGKWEHQVGTRSATVVFGTNAGGTQIGTPTTCGLGYYITYTDGSRTLQRFVAYW